MPASFHRLECESRHRLARQLIDTGLDGDTAHDLAAIAVKIILNDPDAPSTPAEIVDGAWAVLCEVADRRRSVARP